MGNTINYKINVGNNNLEKYCIYLKPINIEPLINSVSKYLDYENIKYRSPSLGHHVTLLTFWADSKNEEEIFYKLDKHKQDRTITILSPDIFGSSYEALVLTTSSYVPEKISDIHRKIVSDMESYILLEPGITANTDLSLFKSKYPFILNNFNPHLTVAKKDNGEFNKEILSSIDQIISTHNRDYKAELYISKKNGEGKWDPVIGFQPTY